LTLTAALLGWMFDGLEMGIFPIAGRPALRDLMQTADEGQISQWMSVAIAVFLIGAAVGGVAFGWLGDRVGRVRAMTLSVLTYSLFTGACYFATEPWHLAALRFIAALGMGGEWALGVALVMESWPGIARPVLAGLIGAASNVGFLMIGIFSWSIKVDTSNWRIVMLAGAAPALLTFFIRIFVPESERWQEAVAREPQAGSPLAEVFGPRLWKTTLLGIAFGSIALIGTWGSVQWIPTWVDKIAGNGPQMAIASSAGAVVGSFFGAVLCGRWGRRPVYFGLCVASLVMCTIVFNAFNAENYAANKHWMLLTVALVGCATAAFYGWLPLYLPELFPTRVRATGQGLSFNFGRIAAAAGALGTGQLVAFFGNDYARAGWTISMIYLVGLVLIWFAPETQGRPLPE
ncbi:MAG: MFS transporter, partial [Planctomycetaceae bacterium]|nr:MFS transporter [Planctomycetaceae bacterium]